MLAAAKSCHASSRRPKHSCLQGGMKRGRTTCWCCMEMPTSDSRRVSTLRAMLALCTMTFTATTAPFQDAAHSNSTVKGAQHIPSEPQTVRPSTACRFNPGNDDVIRGTWDDEHARVTRAVWGCTLMLSAWLHCALSDWSISVWMENSPLYTRPKDPVPMSGPNFRSAKSDSCVLLLRAARGDTAGLSLLVLVWAAAPTPDSVRLRFHDGMSPHHSPPESRELYGVLYST